MRASEIIAGLKDKNKKRQVELKYEHVSTVIAKDARDVIRKRKDLITPIESSGKAKCNNKYSAKELIASMKNHAQRMRGDGERDFNVSDFNRF